MCTRCTPISNKCFLTKGLLCPASNLSIICNLVEFKIMQFRTSFYFFYFFGQSKLPQGSKFAENITGLHF